MLVFTTANGTEAGAGRITGAKRAQTQLRQDEQTWAEIAGVAAIEAEVFHPRRIVRLGLRAGGHDAGNDVDLMVVMETPRRPVEQAVAIRQALELRPSFSLDVLAPTPVQIARGLAEGDWIIEDVMSKGAMLCDAADGDQRWQVRTVER